MLFLVRPAGYIRFATVSEAAVTVFSSVCLPFALLHRIDIHRM